ncbi:MAG: hypothetical protein COA78_32170 [Blastopirellula sp.]|nr:MAG: hypothetical protein COA78_32170 [Blastopirellula sp.]
MNTRLYLKVVAVALFSCAITTGAEKVPGPQYQFVQTYCTDCHDADTNEGELNLDHGQFDWNSGKTLKHWEDVYTMVSRGMMPPEDSDQPTAAERAILLSWLDQQLFKHNHIGGTPMRRLNKREYLNTVRTLFGMSNFELPGSFPQDTESHGFDTMGEALVISPSHFEAYAETATNIADYILPPAQAEQKPKSWTVTPQDMAISYSSAYIIDGAMRLASGGATATRNASWPTKFEAPASGTYKITLTLSTKNPPEDELPQFALAAQASERNGKERLLKKFDVQSGNAQTFEIEADLFQGENLLFRYPNAPLDYEQASYKDFLIKELTKNPKIAAAWKKVGDVPRGGNGWARVKKQMENPDLDISEFTPGSEQIKKVAASIFKDKVKSGETIVYKYFEEGPNIGIHQVKIDGPFQLIEDQNSVRQKHTSKKFLGKVVSEPSDQSLEEFLTRYLTSAFRRPASKPEVAIYTALVNQQLASGYRLEDGLHLAIRTSLLSPSFLYRERGRGELDQYELAARLSYFLTSNAPDAQLLAHAASGDLSDKDILRTEVLRILKNSAIKKQFASDFTSQWLDTNLLDNLMPDPALFKKFSDKHRATMKAEVESTFQEILEKNLPVTDFIDPDFIYTDKIIGKEIYELAIAAKTKSSKFQRYDIPRGTKNGGVLSMAAVMMATANGVDTQPVLRGVWVMENILGTPPPAPPKAVPALPPEVDGSAGPRERLAAHTTDASCARCHREIDPLGFVLENYDAIGRWRTNYASKGKKKGPAVDAAGTLPGGTKLEDVTDLKKWLVEHPEYFTNCIANKLLTYATGRPLNFRERKVIEAIAAKNIQQGNHFQDLLLDLIDSEIFKAK